MIKKKLLLIQLNEINLELVKRYQKDLKFKFFNEEFFKKLLTTNSEKEYELLEPWVQWVSVYTGKQAKDHKIFRLGDIKKYSGDLIFNTIEKLNKSIGIVCSMNLVNNLKEPRYFLSDPWTDNKSGPGKIIEFISKTISQVVNLNSHKSIPINLYFKVLVVILISFRLKNIFLYFKLILNFKKKWNKALLLDLILHDLHLNLLNKNKTDFSSIFFNAGAHIQHHYFLNSKYFEHKNINNPEWYIKKEFDPILDMIIFYDKILFEYKKLDDYDIVLATGLSQKPYDRTKYYYRLKNHAKFLKNLDIHFSKVEPRMTRDFLITFQSDSEKSEAIKKINKLNELNKNIIFSFEERKNSIFTTLSIQHEINKDEQIQINEEKKIFIKDHVVFVALKNGMHDQKGYFYSTFDAKINNIIEIRQQIVNYFTK